MIRQLSTSLHRLSSKGSKAEGDLSEHGEHASIEEEEDRASPKPPAFLDAEEDGDENSGRSSLEKTVRARDSTITALDKKRLEKEEELAELQKELESENLKQMEEAILHRMEVERLQKQIDAMEERLKALERDMQDKEAIHEYANLIKDAAPSGGVDSQYVMKLQSQLAKAMKKMEATSHQMELVEQSCNEVVASLKSEIMEIVEDRCRTELELRKQLKLLEQQKETMEKDYDEQIRMNQEEMERLKQRATNEEDKPSRDLKEELQKAETRLEDLNRTYESQEDAIKQLEETLAQKK